MTSANDYIASTKDTLDQVSPSFCLAKWLQVTIHLHNGQTHSCHHPRTHKIPLEEIQKDPGALHNTQHKQLQQHKMIQGERPSECQYCWNVEDLPGEHLSDRHMKSSDSSWAGSDKIFEIAERAGNGEKINPTYVEVNFSNVCNFKCGYCGPQYSSKWVNEIDKEGPYELTNHKFNDLDFLKSVELMPIHHKEHNPYVDAFWEWWPDLIKDLRVFRITGGEPLLEKNTFKVLDMLGKETPNPGLEVSINSNLGVPTEIIDKYIEKIKYLTINKKIRRSILYTSVDAHGKQAEYGRHGLDYGQWLNNVDKILTELPEVKITIMCTANILSITSFKKLLEDVYELKLKHFSEVRPMALTIDMSILRWPAHYCVSILPPEYAELMSSAQEFMEAKQENAHGNLPYQGFFDFEIGKMKRFVETIKQPINDAEGVDIEVSARDFRLFVDEHDRRRKTNFLETFPELENFYVNGK